MGKIGVDQLATLEKIAERLERRIDKRFDRLEGKDSRMKAWVYQDNGQLKKVGPEKASWYVGWRDPAGKRHGKSCGPGAAGKRLAKKEAERIHAELVTGIYGSNKNKTWADFRADYEAKIVKLKALATQTETESILNTFERIISPNKMAAITTAVIDQFKAVRSAEKSQRRVGESVSPATVNKELRHIKAALRKARKWGYIAAEPEFEMVRQLVSEPSYVDPEQFTRLYAACSKAQLPIGLPYPAAEWWRGLIVVGYMTGWRIGQILSLKRDDVDLDAGEAITRAANAKGKRDKRKPLHPMVVEHLKRLPGFSETVFPWPNHRRTLDNEFHFICTQGGLPEFGFHDLRRGFATMNADRMTADALQDWMEHLSRLTTQAYINLSRQRRQAVPNLFVPLLPGQVQESHVAEVL